MLFVVAVVIFRSCAPLSLSFCGLSILFLSLIVLSFKERHLYENATSLLSIDSLISIIFDFVE